MSLVDRVQALKEKHAALEIAIENESRRAYVDSVAVKELKIQKLAVKDELDRLTRH